MHAYDLRVRAAKHGDLMEAEARRIPCQAQTSAANGFDRLHQHLADLDHVELDVSERQPGRNHFASSKIDS